MSSKRVSPFIRNGLPLIMLVVFGSVGLSTLMSGKTQIGDARKNRRNLTIREYDLEEDYKKTLKKLDLDSKNNDLKIVRIPRDPNETEE